MLTLNDGRSELWQWDTGRKLSVDADCTQVHFSNKVFGRSIDVDVVDGVAIIPDILLQTEKELTAWAFVGTAENGYTKISKAFKVNKRNKPADYVFTVPDQTTLGEILDRIDNLENRPSGDVSKEDIQDAVSDYLDKNPVLFEETDPTVPDWAKRPEKPVYTADEVGALRQGELQTGINLALEQAKTSGAFNGKDGKDGKGGADGKSAYQYAQDAGYAGTEAEFAQDLVTDKITAPSTAQVGQTIVVKEVDENCKPIAWECVDAPSGEGSPFASVTMTGSTYPVLAYANNVITIEPTDLDGKFVILRKKDLSGGITIKLVSTNTPGQYTIYNMDLTVGITDYGSIIPDPSVCVVEVRDANALTISGLGGFDYLKIRITAPLCVSHGARSTYELNYPIYGIDHSYVGKAFECIIETKAYDVIDGKMWITKTCSGSTRSKSDTTNDFSDYAAVPERLILSHYTFGLTIGTRMEVWKR